VQANRSPSDDSTTAAASGRTGERERRWKLSVQGFDVSEKIRRTYLPLQLVSDRVQELLERLIWILR